MTLVIEIIFFLILLFIAIMHVVVFAFYKDLKDTENETKLSGFEIARHISSKYTENEPHIIKKSGKFLDHYNVERNVIKLSPEVFDGTNLYAGVIAANTALDTNPKRHKLIKGHRFSSFLILASYLMIILGSCLNNEKVIMFGLILFILAFIVEFLIIEFLSKTVEKLEDLSLIVKEDKLIEPYDENKEYLTIFLVINIATLPYNFIRYFR